MKHSLLQSTALAGAAIAIAGAAMAAEAPTWKLSGNATFHFYYIDQDFVGTGSSLGVTFATTNLANANVAVQDHGWYLGVDEAEIHVNVSGIADNGLKYGFKIELNANTTDTKAADEVSLSLGGSWGTLLLGDDDGVEDIMNYGGENLIGASGGFDGARGEYGDVLIRQWLFAASFAPSFAVIAGDTSDATKVSYFSPRFSGMQIGASLTPTSNNGDEFKVDGSWEDHYGLGVNYDNAFSGVRIRASAVYSAASSNVAAVEDTAAWSVGGIVGSGPFSIGANYTDNGDSGQTVGSGDQSAYWNVAAAFESGPLYLSAGYLASVMEFGAGGADSEFTTIALTADYTVAPGLGIYAEFDLIEDDVNGGCAVAVFCDNDATVFIAGVNASF